MQGRLGLFVFGDALSLTSTKSAPTAAGLRPASVPGLLAYPRRGPGGGSDWTLNSYAASTSYSIKGNVKSYISPTELKAGPELGAFSPWAG